MIGSIICHAVRGCLSAILALSAASLMGCGAGGDTPAATDAGASSANVSDAARGDARTTGITLIAGQWVGTWMSDMGQSGDLSADVHQFYDEQMTQDALSGSVTMSGSPCLTSGNLLGQTTGDTASLLLTQDATQINVTGVIAADSRSIVGTYLVKFGACMGDRGRVTLTKR